MAKKKKINQADAQKKRKKLIKELNELKDDLRGLNTDTDQLIKSIKPRSVKEIKSAIKLLEAEKSAISSRFINISGIDWEDRKAITGMGESFSQKEDAATKWAYIKRYKELERDGFIPSDIELDKYEGGAVLGEMLRMEELMRVVEEATEKRAQLIRMDEERQVRVQAQAKRIGDLLNAAAAGKKIKLQ